MGEEMREFVKHIATSLREDDTWTLNDHWTFNDKLGVKVWIANGYWFVYIEWATERQAYGRWADGRRVDLSLLEKFVIWRAAKKFRKLARRRADNKVLESIIQRRLNGETK
jgi:hypothetical protein